MKTATHDFIWSAAVGTPGRVFRAPPLPGPATRTELPVVSNRAFISAWMTRRNQLAAAARAARKVEVHN